LKDSFKQFMDGIIDYAGLFPPAKLVMFEAVSNFSQYQTDSDAWMLSRFICPTNRLPEFGQEFRKLANSQSCWKMSVLPGNGNTVKEYLDSFDLDIHHISGFSKVFKNNIIIDFLEIRLPAELYHNLSARGVTSFLMSLIDILEKYQISSVNLFIELSGNKDWKKNVSEFIGSVSQFTRSETGSNGILSNIGFKLRCGGLEASAFPSPEEVSIAIHECAINNVPFKATAGLHHPMRHFNQGVKTIMHGFLNIFVAALLAFKYYLLQEDIEQIVEDENPSNFIFMDSDLKWKSLEISAEEIKSFRAEKVISFGSCSFDEPREDLRSLNFL
jgi:hypothetical protein